MEIISQIQQIMHELSSLIKHKKVRIKLSMNNQDIDSLDTFIVPGDELLICSMIGNIIKNAIEASPKESLVEIKMSREDDTALFNFTTNGEIPAKMRDVFFNKYTTHGKLGGGHRTGELFC